MSRAVLLATNPDAQRAWAGDVESVREVGTDLQDDDLALALNDAGCALIEARGNDAVALARRVHSADPTLQTVLIVPEDEHSRTERLLMFAPGLGEVWTVAPGAVNTDLVNRAADVTSTRRSYRTTKNRLVAGMRRAPRRSTEDRILISDAYLAALLDVLPDPVLSVDWEGRILSWNPAATRLLGHTMAEALGRRAGDLLLSAGQAFDALIRRSENGAASGELEIHAKSGEPRIVEIRVVPVHAGSHFVRSVVLHDVTEERQVQAELELQAAHLEEQTAELEELNTVLQERSDDLEFALATRSRFYASMSHELRTPLNAIIGYNELLLEELFGPLAERQVESIAKAQRAARHLLELINDVLDLAKIEAGRIDLQEQETTFPIMLRELMDTVAPLAEEHGSELTLKGDAEPRTIRTDPRRVRQILLNLLSNAIKFGAGEPVDLAWSPLPDGGVRIDVVDRGRGISEADLNRIFEEFVQVDPAERTGTGLGLSISRRLAEILGGTLSAVSEPDEGSTFSITLPADMPSANASNLLPGADRAT